MSFSSTSGRTHFLNNEIAVHNRKVLEESIVEMLKISQRILKNKPKCTPVEPPSHILRESHAYWSKIRQISCITLHLISQFYCLYSPMQKVIKKRKQVQGSIIKSPCLEQTRYYIHDPPE